MELTTKKEDKKEEQRVWAGIIRPKAMAEIEVLDALLADPNIELALHPSFPALRYPLPEKPPYPDFISLSEIVELRGQPYELSLAKTKSGRFQIMILNGGSVPMQFRKSGDPLKLCGIYEFTDDEGHEMMISVPDRPMIHDNCWDTVGAVIPPMTWTEQECNDYMEKVVSNSPQRGSRDFNAALAICMSLITTRFH